MAATRTKWDGRWTPRSIRIRNSIVTCSATTWAKRKRQRFLAKLGRDRWPDQSMQASDWRYDHLRNMPSTFVLCLQDGILTPPWQERFAERLNTQRMVRIDAGHQVMNTRPHALAETLRHEASVT